jgi:hypothetical protein
MLWHALIEQEPYQYRGPGASLNKQRFDWREARKASDARSYEQAMANAVTPREQEASSGDQRTRSAVAKPRIVSDSAITGPWPTDVAELPRLQMHRCDEGFATLPPG